MSGLVEVRLRLGGDAAGDQLDSIENLVGSAHGDTLGGDDSDNVINGLAGDNNLYGYGGNDVLWGGDDKDSLDGGEGTDVLKGFGGNDFLIAGTPPLPARHHVGRNRR